MADFIADNIRVALPVSLLVSFVAGYYAGQRYSYIHGVITTIVSVVISSALIGTIYIRVSRAELMKSEETRVRLEEIELEKEKITEKKKAEARKAETRFNEIASIMESIKAGGNPCILSPGYISTWRDGLNKIKRCPSNEGYYLATANRLERIDDYRSAAMVLGSAIDILNDDPPSITICEQLNRYYKILGNKPSVTKDCIKFHDL